LPSPTLRQRGFAALVAGNDAPALKSPREFDREVCWARWKRGQSDS
jgi:hypothetical protein